MAAARQTKLFGRTAPAATSRPIFSWIFGGSEDVVEGASADNSIYEVRAYHHGKNWTADTKARCVDFLAERAGYRAITLHKQLLPREKPRLPW
eukprot:SAG11_NODE_4250_length_1986_cov_1.946476_1_plen_93_part_00